MEEKTKQTVGSLPYLWSHTRGERECVKEVYIFCYNIKQKVCGCIILINSQIVPLYELSL
jgi:hypothetical protein